MPAKPQAWIDACSRAHRRVSEILAGLTDEMARRPSRLPDWTCGHVLIHLARNADANTGMVEGAQRGEVDAMYPGGQEQRGRDIEAGFAGPAAALRDDVNSALERLEHAWASTSEEVWATGMGRTFCGLRAIGFTVLMRWREVECHLADLGLTELGAPDWDGLSREYVEAEWLEQTPFIGRRLPEGAGVIVIPGDRPSRVYGHADQPLHVRASAPRILQWIMGRGGEPGWPQLSQWS